MLRSGHAASVLSVAFSANGQRIASSSHDGTVCVWHARTASRLHSLRGHSRDMTGGATVAFSTDGVRLLSISDDATLGVWISPGAQLVAALQAARAKVNMLRGEHRRPEIDARIDDHAGFWVQAICSGRLPDDLCALIFEGMRRF